MSCQVDSHTSGDCPNTLRGRRILAGGRRATWVSVVLRLTLLASLHLGGGSCLARVTVVDDDFESGGASGDWFSLAGQGVAVVYAPGTAAAGSNYYARVEGVAVGGSGLGVSLVGATPGSAYSTDFTIELDLRVDAVPAGVRQFGLIGSAGSAAPNTNSAQWNIRYQDNAWWAYDGSWRAIPGLRAIAANTWNHVSIAGNDWGTGNVGNASFDIHVTDHLGAVHSATSLKLWQNASTGPDLIGATALTINDTFGSNPGFDVDNVVVTATPAPPAPTEEVVVPVNPVAYSGIFPHTAVSNTYLEVGIGGVIRRQNTLYYMTYGPHVAAGGSDELYSLDLTTLQRTTHLLYPGSTDANRYRDNRLGIDVVGAAYIDDESVIRYLPVAAPGDLRGRITGTSAHLTDANKLYYMTMEEGLYEVDFSDLEHPVIGALRADGNFGGSRNLPGVHGKGLYTAQERLFFTNNGQGEGFGGGLVEWDGNGDPSDSASWRLVDTAAQYTEVTSRRGPVDMDPDAVDAVWATGWDEASLFINTRDAITGLWTKFRLPQSSYTHSHPNGWYTEWPRIRDVGLDAGYLMSHHGMMFTVPETFSSGDPSGVLPLTTHHKMIVDYVESGDQIIFAANDSSKFDNSLVTKANSNIQFVDKAALPSYGGRPSGFGGVWVNESVSSGATSDPLLISGFRHRVIHFEHENSSAVDYLVEIDVDGHGHWTPHTTVTVPGASSSGYAAYQLPSELAGQWIRFQPSGNVNSASVYLHMSNGSKARDPALVSSLADVRTPTAKIQGLLRSNGDRDYKLEFAADVLGTEGSITESHYYRAQLNADTQALEIVRVADAAAEAAVRADAATEQDFGVDAASVFINKEGTRYRLPKGDSAFDNPTASGPRRGIREVVTERELMNIHGTFYELPRDFLGGGIQRIRPISTHNLDIFDFASWRGMLVLSGVNSAAENDEHFVRSDDGKVGLWFGNVDDLWSFGPPQGVGGPWRNSSTIAGAPSDPYLMTGYDHKKLELSHTADQSVNFLIEVDFLGTGQWEEYATLSVAPRETLTHEFADAYSAHWVRVTSSVSTTATAWFTYTAEVTLPGDYNADGVVDAADYTVWQDNRGASITLPADTTPGVIDTADYGVWRANFGRSVASSITAFWSIPEPTSCDLCRAVAILLCVSRRPSLGALQVATQVISRLDRPVPPSLEAQ